MGDRRRGRRTTALSASRGRRGGGSPPTRGTSLGNRTTNALLRNPAVPQQVAGGGTVVQRRNQLATAQLDQDSIFETLAHEMAYEEGLTHERRSRLHALGYRPLRLERGPQGLECRAFVDNESSPPPRPAVLAFRGTQEFEDLLADLHGGGVGFGQLQANVARIGRYLDEVGERVVVTGHSLGGAMAQLAAATFPDKVRQIVTFNAPGIATRLADQLRQYNERADEEHQIGSRHYRAEGDIVDDAGEAHTEGQVIEVGTDSVVPGHQTDSLTAHTRYVLWDLQRIRTERGEEAYQRARVRVSATTRGDRPVEAIRQAVRRLILATIRITQGAANLALRNPLGVVDMLVDTAAVGREIATIQRSMPHVPPAERAALVTQLRGLRETISSSLKPVLRAILPQIPGVGRAAADAAADAIADGVYENIMSGLNLQAP